MPSSRSRSNNSGKGGGDNRRDRGRNRIRALAFDLKLEAVALQRVGGCSVDGCVVLDGDAIVAHL